MSSRIWERSDSVALHLDKLEAFPTIIGPYFVTRLAARADPSNP